MQDVKGFAQVTEMVSQVGWLPAPHPELPGSPAPRGRSPSASGPRWCEGTRDLVAWPQAQDSFLWLPQASLPSFSSASARPRCPF